MNNKQLTLGSLFSGSGGFELAGTLAGIKPIWNSEVEPFPIAVTCRRFPDVKHYGDVSALSGADLEPVDIITFGSPCTDLSIAGKRAGLDGEHSGLFHEAIRIIKEMREKTDGQYPRYAVWENVFGAFSSHKGEDFKAVLEAFVQIAEPEAPPVPMPEKGAWPYADVLLGDGWSVAYRTLDSQWWGVPQRRRRIYLVADFGGRSAGKVLFKSEGMSRYTPQGFRSWEGTAGNPPQGAGTTGGSGGDGRGRLILEDQGGSRIDVGKDITSTLRAETHGHPPCVMEEGAAGFCTEHSANARSIGYEEERSPTLRAGVVPAVVPLENHPADSRIRIEEDGKVQTLSGRMGTGGNNVPLLMEEQVPITMKIRSGCAGGGKGQICQVDKSATLGCSNDQTVFVPEKSEQPEPCYWDGGQTAGTLTDKNARGVQRMPDKQNFNCVLEPEADTRQTVFGISSFKSHAMLSDNPHAGIYEAETTRTLDCNGGSPVQNQGGMAIVEQEKCYDIRQTSEGTKVSRCHCYETDTARSLGTTYPDPAGNHGGVAVVRGESEEPVAFTQNQRDEVRDLGDKSGSLQAQPGAKQQTYVLQGNMIGRDDKNGPRGCGVSEDVCYTLTDVDRHAVVVPDDPVYAMTTGCFTHVEKDVSPTLMARDYKDPTTVAPVKEVEPHYTVRRLTPTECARLQGFPDWWCSDLGNPDPTDEEVAFWMDVWETHREVVSHASKPKTEKQVRKWLADPYSDSAVYKLYGNGISLPVAFFVLCGVVWAAEKEQ